MSTDGWLKDLARDLLGMFVPTRATNAADARLEAARAAVRETLAERNAVLEHCVATRERAEALVDETERDLRSAPDDETPDETLSRRLLTVRSGLREALRAERAARIARDAALAAGRSALTAREPGAGAAPGAVMSDATSAWDALSARLVEAGGWFAPGEPAAELAARAIAQASDLAEKHARFLDVLARKLHAGELAHARYADAAERVSDSVLRNLESAAAGLGVLHEVDAPGVRDAIATLERSAARSGAAAREAEALRGRLRVAATEEERIGALLASNEAAATALVEAAAAVGALRDLDAAGTPDLQLALADLERLARRASDYA